MRANKRDLPDVDFKDVIQVAGVIDDLPTCEELVDLEENFQLWRFRHLKTVERIIGMKTGTGGSSGAPFLKRALELTFFPELYAVRTRIGS